MSDCVVKEHVKIIALKESKLIYSVVGMRMIFSLGALAYCRYIYVYFDTATYRQQRVVVFF